MSKVKTQYGDLTEKQWKLVVVEKLIAIEKDIIKLLEVSMWTDKTKEEVAKYEGYMRQCEQMEKERKKAKT